MQEENPHHVQVASGNAKFATKFYNILAQNKDNAGKNLFFSPLSAHTILALTYQGAGGKTAEDFAQTLFLADKDVAAKGYNSVMNLLNNIEKVTLHVANKIFVKLDFPLKEKFSKAASELFLSEAQLLDFTKNAECASIINNWVEEKTNSKIKDLVSKSDFDKWTRLVLVNAVYFKGDWAFPFNKSLTKVEPFYTSKDVKVDCNMMHIKKRFRFSDNADLGAKILELPYSNRDISMVIILPNEIDGIADLEEKLVNVDLSTITENLYTEEVEVSLPKFKIETTMDLKSVLNAMGLGIIFDSDNCDLSEISESCEPLVVSKVIQKAFIEVNEEGAEAAAATAVVMVACCMMTVGPPCTFKADRPFIIYIQSRGENSKLILFAGKVSAPEMN